MQPEPLDDYKVFRNLQASYYATLLRITGAEVSQSGSKGITPTPLKGQKLHQQGDLSTVAWKFNPPPNQFADCTEVVVEVIKATCMCATRSIYFTFTLFYFAFSAFHLQCFDPVGWAAERASGL